MTEQIPGHLQSASWQYDGVTLAADATAGDTALLVDTVVDLEEIGGTLLLPDPDGGPSYTAIVHGPLDDDTDTDVPLLTGLPVDLDSGDTLYVLNEITGQPIRELEALVWIDDADDDDGDPIPATVKAGLVDQLTDSLDSLAGLAVSLEVDEHGDLWVTDVPGTQTGLDQVKAYEDSTSDAGQPALVGGDVTLYLTYQPDPEHSEHLYWNGVYQPKGTWTRDGWTVTIPDPDGLVTADDEFVMEYLYRDPATFTPPSATMALVGSTHLDGGFGTALSIPLPAGTSPGDLVVFAVSCRSTGAGVNVTDSRVLHNVHGVPAGGPAFAYALGYFRADSGLSDFQVTTPASWGGSGRTELVSFQVDGTITAVDTAPVLGPGTGPLSLSIPGGCTLGIMAAIGQEDSVPGPVGGDLLGNYVEVSPTIDSAGDTTGGGFSSTTIGFDDAGCDPCTVHRTGGWTAGLILGVS